jgi:MarR family 2-MHQ and catechol resistance regulon transcriptional repressor
MANLDALRSLLATPGGASPLSDSEPQDDAAVQSALHLWVVLARAHASVASREQRDLLRYKLTRAEFGVLDALFFKGPLLIGDIQRKMLVSSSGTTYLIDRLENRGLVRRSPSQDDRRAIYATLTDAGERFFREIFADHVRGLAKSVSGLDVDEQTEVTRLLKKLGTGAVRLTDAETPG